MITENQLNILLNFLDQIPDNIVFDNQKLRSEMIEISKKIRYIKQVAGFDGLKIDALIDREIFMIGKYEHAVSNVKMNDNLYQSHGKLSLHGRQLIADCKKTYRPADRLARIRLMEFYKLGYDAIFNLICSRLAIYGISDLPIFDEMGLKISNSGNI